MTTTTRALAALAITSALAVPALADPASTHEAAPAFALTDGSHGHGATRTARPVPGRAVIGDIVIEGAWTRETPPGARAGGGYARVTNTGTQADTLVGGSAPFTNRLEVHEMSVTEGVMRMAELTDGLVIAPGETVELRPGGFHMMFIDMTKPPVAGSSVSVTLEFERAGTVTLDLPVAAIGATSPDGAPSGLTMDHGTMTMDAEVTN